MTYIMDRKERIEQGITRLYFALLRKIETPGYRCIHQFFKDFSLFIQASRLLFYRETEEGWKRLCDVKEKNRDGGKESHPHKDIKPSEISEKIEWRPGQMPRLEDETGEGELLYIIPIWYDDRLNFRKNLIVIIKPRLLDLENMIETPKPREKDPLYTRFYRLIYYYLTKSSYEHRLQGEMCNAIVRGDTTMPDANASISPKNRDKVFPGLLGKDFSWPMGFSEIKSLFEACWATYSHITSERQTETESAVPEGEAFWERGGLKGKKVSTRRFWEYLESRIRNKLCYPCETPLCGIEEQKQFELYLNMYPFIKWPLLFREEMYTIYSSVSGEDKDTGTNLVKGYLEQVVDFNKKYPFIRSLEREEERDERAGKRFFVHFR